MRSNARSLLVTSYLYSLGFHTLFAGLAGLAGFAWQASQSNRLPIANPNSASVSFETSRLPSPRVGTLARSTSVESSHLAPAIAGSAAQTFGTQPVASPFDSYLSLVREKIRNGVYYPIALRRQGITGNVELSVKLTSDGQLQDAVVESSSGISELDQLAIEAVKRAAPFRPPPQGAVSFTLPIEYRLRN